MNTNTLHLKRAIRSSRGITKIPYSLAEPATLESDLNQLRDKLSAFGTVIRIKPTHARAGWVHILGFNKR